MIHECGRMCDLRAWLKLSVFFAPWIVSVCWPLSRIAIVRSKHVQRARIVLYSADRLPVQEVARRASVSRPAVWRWQARYAEQGVEGLLRDRTRKPGRAPLSAKVVSVSALAWLVASPALDRLDPHSPHAAVQNWIALFSPLGLLHSR
jgi:hypothetical protein